MTYETLIERSAQRSLSKITQPHQDRIIEAINTLRSNPRPVGVQKLSGREAWRIRVGDYRVIYEINDEASRVLVATLGHRREVCRFGR